jgi:hypothetical protein
VQLLSFYCILRDESELVNNCYDFPSKDFGKSNSIRSEYGTSPKVLLDIGDTAIDFTLKTIEGKSVTLSTLLENKPVVLLWGHYTCPAFQGLHADTMFIGSSYEEEYKLIEAIGHKVTVVHLVGPEPHPIWPYANFDSGSLKMNYWSTIRFER